MSLRTVHPNVRKFLTQLTETMGRYQKAAVNSCSLTPQLFGWLWPSVPRNNLLKEMQYC